MWRYYYTIIKTLPRLPGALKDMENLAKKITEKTEEYSEEENYAYIRYVVDAMKQAGHVETEAFGIENLPKEGGYMMYPNHEGQWDVYGLISVHDNPCTFVMDIRKSNRIFIKQIVDCIHAKRLDKIDNRQAIKIINDVAKEVEAGRRYVLFPEGDFYPGKKNTLMDFKAGCFKASLKSKTPIVPVVLYDAYKVYNSWQLGKVTTQVHFLKPIQFEEYKDLNTHEIADLVKAKIQEKINELDKRV